MIGFLIVAYATAGQAVWLWLLFRQWQRRPPVSDNGDWFAGIVVLFFLTIPIVLAWPVMGPLLRRET